MYWDTFPGKPKEAEIKSSKFVLFPSSKLLRFVQGDKYIISKKSPANMEITWGQCPRVPKENGGLMTNVNFDDLGV